MGAPTPWQVKGSTAAGREAAIFVGRKGATRRRGKAVFGMQKDKHWLAAILTN